MTVEVETPSTDTAVTTETTRLVMTGSCEGLADLRESIATHAGLDLRGWCEEVHEAAGLLASGPGAVLHATPGSSPPEAELAAIREYTDAPIILVTPEGSTGLLDPDAGDVADVLLLPQPAENVAFILERARNGGRARDAQPSGGSRIFTVFSPKGGTGKSVIATNLAVALAADGVRTLLLDLQLELGDAALMLGSDPEKTIYDLVLAPGALDSDKLVGYTARHASGLDVLAAPLRPEQAELVTEEKLARILEVAKESYQAVIVDTPASFHGTLLTALDRTDSLLLVCELDMTTLKNVRITLETLQLLKFPAERISLVLNQASPSRAMKRSELEAALGARVRFELPYDEGVPVAVGLGKPIVLERKGGFARAVLKIASELAPQGAAKKRGWSIAADPRPPAGGSTKQRRWSALRRA
jgi:Flp pilus assembly CpaE family ATPase